LPDTRLVADIGGTFIRLAIAEDGVLGVPQVRRTAEYGGLEDAACAFLAGLPTGTRPTQAVVAVAAPITGDTIRLTNTAWSFSRAAAKAALGLEELLVVNDFAATAMAIPHFGPADIVPVGTVLPAGDGPVAILGPGTGLGMASMARTAQGFFLVAGEGGHATMPASTREEDFVIDRLRARFGHVSAERVLSGPGLENIYLALGGENTTRLAATEITARAVAGGDELCVRALKMFFGMLGTVASNLALTMGATGGVYIAGGIVPRLRGAFLASDFRARFEAKGRFSSYLAAIPTWLVVHEEPALLGLAHWKL
jgi:glucokinase